MNPRRTSIRLIEKAVRENWLRQLAFFHILKYNYINSCIYDYRSRMSEIATYLNVSEKTLYNYFRELRKKDLICDHSSNLILKSIKDFRSFKKNIIEIDSSNSVFDVCCLLSGKMIEKKVHQMAFMESLRRFGSGDLFKDVQGENRFRPSLSYRSIAKLLNCSEYKAFRVVKNLNRLNVIRTTKQKPTLLSNNFNRIDAIEDFPGHRFCLNGCLYEVPGSLIDLLKFPAFLNRISLKQYRIFKKNLANPSFEVNFSEERNYL